MRMTKISLLAVTATLVAMMATPAAALSPVESLGKKLFFDTSLSANGTQSCASCHAPDTGFTGPHSAVNAGKAVYEGAIPHHFGNRKPPTSAYAGESPVLYQDVSGGWFGGMFWDGRATGSVLHDPLAEQAKGPYLNPLEQAVPNAKALCVKVKKARYAGLFEEVWGDGSLDCAADAEGVYDKIGRSVAAYERSTEVNPFSSRFDRFWDEARALGKEVALISCGTAGRGGRGGGSMQCSGDGTDPDRWTTFRNLGLTDAELQGLANFNDPDGANCASCHPLQAGPQGYPLFTDFGYDNLGIPKNPDNPFYQMPPRWNPDGKNWVDYGLGGYLKSAGHAPEVYEPELGKFKVPTLRNLDLRPYKGFVKAYGHNGYFKSLEEIVLFYHWRAMMDAGCGGRGGTMGGSCRAMASMFPPPELDQNRGTLDVFPRHQVDNIVLFLKTLSDGYYRK